MQVELWVIKEWAAWKVRVKKHMCERGAIREGSFNKQGVSVLYKRWRLSLLWPTAWGMFPETVRNFR